MRLKESGVLTRAILGVGLISGGLSAFASQANALTIIPNYTSVAPGSTAGDTTTASDPNAAAIEATINQDIATLDSYIANPITINITFEELPAGNDGLADSNSNFYLPTYSTYLSDLQTKQTRSAADNSALATLPAGPANPVNGNTSMSLNGNLLSALGDTSVATGGYVEFNAGTTFYSRSAPVVGKYDLQSAIAHELDEELNIGGAGSNLNSVATGSPPSDPVGALDLFRYSAPGVRSYSTSNTVSSYFSIDGGNTDLVHFNQAGATIFPPAITPSGSDYADWGNGAVPAVQDGNTPSQVQDAYSSDVYDGTNIGIYPNLGPNELTALDVVGWDLTPLGTAVETGASVPEPASLGLLAAGAVSILARRRRVAAV